MDAYEKLTEKFTHEICGRFLDVNSRVNISYPGNRLNQEASGHFLHVGLYAFVLELNGGTGIAYVGKTEGGERIRAHLTGKTKKGKDLAPSLGTKHKEIKAALKKGYKVYLALEKMDELKKSILSCLEIECILEGREQLKKILRIPSWNKRAG